MKSILILCVVLVLGVVGYFVWDSSQPKHFGEAFVNAPSVKATDLLANPAAYANQPITLVGQVQKQCPVTGCFFYFTENGKEVKVELGNSVTSLPKKGGTEARVEGQLFESGKEGWVFIGKGVEFNSKNPLPPPAVAKSTPPPATTSPATVTQTATATLGNYPLKTCVVSGEELGSMGAPFEYTYQTRNVKFCCGSCVKKFEKEPAKYLQKLDAAAQVH